MAAHSASVHRMGGLRNRWVAAPCWRCRSDGLGQGWFAAESLNASMARSPKADWQRWQRPRPGPRSNQRAFQPATRRRGRDAQDQRPICQLPNPSLATGGLRCRGPVGVAHTDANGAWCVWLSLPTGTVMAAANNKRLQRAAWASRKAWSAPVVARCASIHCTPCAALAS